MFAIELKSNKKYYYTCRTIDAHGHTSNPSPIYEIELVNDEGSIYMTKKAVDFLPREPKLPTKGMRRLLLIRPLLEQTFIDDTLLVNVDSAFDVKNVKLGKNNYQNINFIDFLVLSREGRGVDTKWRGA